MSHNVNDELRKYAEGLERALGESSSAPGEPPSRSHRIALAFLAVATVAVVLVGVAWFTLGERGSQELGTGGPESTETQGASTSCADVEAFGELLGKGRTLDYQPSYSIEQLRSRADRVLDGELVAVSDGPPPEAEGDASVVLLLEGTWVDPEDGETPASQVEVQVSSSPLVPYEEYAAAAPLGARVVAFVGAYKEGRYRPHVEGLWFGCGPLDRPTPLTVAPLWAVSSLDDLLMPRP